MPYHVVLDPQKDGIEVKFDLTAEELEKFILEPYRGLRPIVVGGRTILPETLHRIQVVETPYLSTQFQPATQTLARQGTREWAFAEPDAKDVSDQFIITPSFAAIPQNTDAVELLCGRFHAVVRQLRERHDGRGTLDVNDEYDVQNLMHSLLRIFFDDIRAEEWTPSYAGKSSRMDFFLPEAQVVVETKKTRQSLGDKQLGSELIEDIARYKIHPGCKRLICFVYDPEARVLNPGGIERDLNARVDGLPVKVIITPKP